jgi:hypothetical protein
LRKPRGQVSAQCHDVPYAAVAVALKHLAHRSRRRGDARNVRGRGVALRAYVEHRSERALTRRPPCTERDRKEFRLELRKLPGGLTQVLLSFQRIGRKELETERAPEGFLGLHLSTYSDPI